MLMPFIYLNVHCLTLSEQKEQRAEQAKVDEFTPGCICVLIFFFKDNFSVIIVPTPQKRPDLWTDTHSL